LDYALIKNKNKRISSNKIFQNKNMNNLYVDDCVNKGPTQGTARMLQININDDDAATDSGHGYARYGKILTNRMIKNKVEIVIRASFALERV
jgi:hypothetical protein